jgi:two-component system chemotaxis response regulator CheB
MPPLFTKSLADDLNNRCRLHVLEAADGHLAEPGECLVAPGGKQMKIERTELGPRVQITDDPPENSCRPAVDYLFRSAAHQYGGQVLAVVMTGMGSDGTLGCRLLKRHGAHVLAQDKATCVVYGMPASVVENGLADSVLPLGELAAAIQSIAQGKTREAVRAGSR